jgi:16S rRNA (guanine1207-N2)-methyltransferase
VTFDVILANPPIRAGWAAIAAMIAQAHERLGPAGRFYVVGRTDKGVRTLARRMGERFPHVGEVAKRAGYRVYVAMRNSGANVEKDV